MAVVPTLPIGKEDIEAPRKVEDFMVSFRETEGNGKDDRNSNLF